VSIGNEKLMDSHTKVHEIAENNMEDDESHQEEEDDDSFKQEKADNEWESEHEKEEDKINDDEDLSEEELQTLFNTIYAKSKIKVFLFFPKVRVRLNIYHGSCLSKKI
jgi:hypothetical protein